MNASNSTLAATIDGQQVIYKPISGERPLWDFPESTLALRERAAYITSELLGWDLVPETILRDGPEGPGSVQRWVDAENYLADIFAPNETPDGWHSILSGTDEDGDVVVLAHAPDNTLAKLAVFDALINNADRKAGHILADNDGRIFAIDHGVTFHHEDKLRTVLWGWIDKPIHEQLLDDIERIIPLINTSELTELLNAEEIEALHQRAHSLITDRTYPTPNPHWPAVPWPVF